MGFDHRKQLEGDQNEDRRSPCLPLSPLPPTPKRPPEPRHDNHFNQMHFIKTGISITAFVVVGVLFVAVTLTIINKYYSRRNRRRRNSAILFDTREEFLDDDHGPVIGHPIWLIHTVGLQQSVIESITVCKYKKDEGLIDGTECSVCLSEFEEDESLRLLPKCSHAFHLPCIDTWLTSHKNCPLCRAPIVSNNTTGSQVTATEPNVSVSGPSQETQEENLENYSGVENNRDREEESSGVGVGDGNFRALAIEDGRCTEILNKVIMHNSSCSSNCHSQAQSNLADNQRVMEEEIQPMRRSVSLDSNSALKIYHAVANIVTDQGSSKSQSINQKSSGKKIVDKLGSGNSSISKLVKSSSAGLSLQKGPISMKRSCSSSRSFLSSRHFKSVSSILPLGR